MQTNLQSFRRRSEAYQIHQDLHFLHQEITQSRLVHQLMLQFEPGCIKNKEVKRQTNHNKELRRHVVATVCCGCCLPLIFRGMEAEHDKVFQVYAAIPIKLGLGEPPVYFEPVINTNY